MAGVGSCIQQVCTGGEMKQEMGTGDRQSPGGETSALLGAMRSSLHGSVRTVLSGGVPRQGNSAGEVRGRTVARAQELGFGGHKLTRQGSPELKGEGRRSLQQAQARNCCRSLGVPEWV